MVMEKSRTCHLCGNVVTGFCPTCKANFPNRRPVDQMTVQERVAEFTSIGSPLEYEFSLVHQRIQELVGREVWTHELTRTGFDQLVEEIRTAEHPSLGQIIAKIPGGKPIVVVVPDGS